MRLSLSLPLTLTVAALALSGCVQNPGTMPPTAIVPPVVTPNPDAAVRSSARVVVNREMAKRLPGRNVAPYTACVLDNATDAEIEQAAFAPSNMVPGVGVSPDKMLLSRVFAYADAHRYRVGPNFHQLPVNRPKVPVNTYMFGGPMEYLHTGSAPVYAPNSASRPWSDEQGRVDNGWQADGDMVRSAYTLRPGDDDFSQPGTMVREVFSEAEREALVNTVAGSLSGGVREPVLSRAFDYWKSIDANVGRRIEEKVLAGSAPQPAEGMGEG